jgi:5'-3' exonuclease
VISSDTDFYQLLQNHNSLKLYNPVKKEFITPPPFDYVTWKALRGDATDNIPGFKGVGDKRALSLVESPNDLETFLARDDNRTMFERNCQMIRFHNLTEDLKDLEINEPKVDWQDLRTIFDDMKFFSITNDKSWLKFVKTFQH